MDLGDGLAVVRGSGVDRVGAAAATPDGSTIFATRARAVDTDLVVISTHDGEVLNTLRLAGAWAPAVAGGAGNMVALVAPAKEPGAPVAAYAPAGRPQTSMLIVGAETDPVRVDLSGNYVPDAFTVDGHGIYVLDWQPATAPEHYRVREVNLVTKAPTPLLTRDKVPIPPGAEEEMRGRRRNAVFAPNHDVLYTLYTNQPGAAAADDAWPDADLAFIHTLQLDQHWAYCVDLPSPFGVSPNAGHPLAIRPDGGQLYVVDAAGGHLAVVDSDSLTVDRVANVEPLPGNAFAVAAADAVFIAAGARVLVLGRPDLTVRTRWELPGTALGLASSVDGSRVYVGLGDAIEWRDAATGRRLGRVTVPGVTGLRSVT